MTATQVSFRFWPCGSVVDALRAFDNSTARPAVVVANSRKNFASPKPGIKDPVKMLCIREALETRQITLTKS